ncbi:hypothetical protein ITJ54_06585 [Curtobacterium sp. VKM Ac-2865]|uniref:hypothetical protein n=1 Tax=Curtobacterium sp. VKM Ac-2865 TaxID=2783817 RepID=UPI00188AB26B|nr:hypothetical protein [Curtobacterium sp. VKM Ac-2865]MBF4582336.1 hypothetical protein [Curtobacterium sp. VKM Ac-2865]
MAEFSAHSISRRWRARDAGERSTQLMLIGFSLAGLPTAGFVDPEDPLLQTTPKPRALTAEAQIRSLDWLQRAALGLIARSAPSGWQYGLAADMAATPRQLDEPFLVARPGDEVGSDADRLLANIATFSSARSAVALMNMSLADDDELVRTVAAAVLHSLGRTREETVQAVLQAARDSVVATVSALGGLVVGKPGVDYSAGDESGTDDHAEADSKDGPPDDSVDDARGACSVMVHGTFARLTSAKKRWYDPGSDLSMHVRRHASRNLYAGRDYVRWTAGFSDVARAQGTTDLLTWCARHGLDALDTVYAHSHGGNVVLDAIERGLRVKLLVLMHVPVIERSAQSWSAIERNVGRALDLRTARDLVVAADRLHRKANHLPLSENRTPQLPWIHRPRRSALYLLDTSHKRFVQLKTWQKNAVANDVRFAWLMA